MRKPYLYVVISLLVLLSFSAVAGEAGSNDGGPQTLDEKKARAYELRYTTKPQERQELFSLIVEITPEGFFEQFNDDSEELLKAFKQILNVGPTTTEQSVVRAALAAFLLKDKRPEIRNEAIKQITRMSLYADKLFVGDTLFDMYKATTDDDELRARIAKAMVLVGSNDVEGKAPLKLTEDDYKENLGRFKEMLGDKSPVVRRAVVENLLRTYETMASAGVGMLETDPDPGVRGVVIDYYREAKVKTARVVEMVLKTLESDDLGELGKALDYCEAMKMDEAREPMFAALKRHLDQDGQPANEPLRTLELRMIDMARDFEWKDAIPDLVSIYKADSHPAIQTRAAYVILSLSGTLDVLLGTIKEPFPANMVEPERKALMLAFDAWLLETQEIPNETEEAKQERAAAVRRMREKAQIEFTDAAYAIAKARITDSDFANKRRGLKLVMDIGPDEFAKDVDARSYVELLQSLQILWQRYSRPEQEANRHIARMVLGFVSHKDRDVRLNALDLLSLLARFCDRDVFLPKLRPMVNNPDQEIDQLVRRLMEVIGQSGYSGEEERENQRRHEEREKARSKEQ